MNYDLRLLVKSGLGQTDRQAESDTYEPTVQLTQIGSETDPLAHFALARPSYSSNVYSHFVHAPRGPQWLNLLTFDHELWYGSRP